MNVHVEEAASDRELRGLRELRELAQKRNQNWLCHTWCIPWPILIPTCLGRKRAELTVGSTQLSYAYGSVLRV